jgi:predicted MFS family arabinose efflux permease
VRCADGFRPLHGSRAATARVSATLFVCLFAAQSAFLVLGPILPDVAYEFDIGSAAAGLTRRASQLEVRG